MNAAPHVLRNAERSDLDLSSKLLAKGTLKVYPGLGHGLCTINADVVNADLLAYIEG